MGRNTTSQQNPTTVYYVDVVAMTVFFKELPTIFSCTNYSVHFLQYIFFQCTVEYFCSTSMQFPQWIFFVVKFLVVYFLCSYFLDYFMESISYNAFLTIFY